MSSATSTEVSTTWSKSTSCTSKCWSWKTRKDSQAKIIDRIPLWLSTCILRIAIGCRWKSSARKTKSTRRPLTRVTWLIKNSSSKKLKFREIFVGHFHPSKKMSRRKIWKFNVLSLKSGKRKRARICHMKQLIIRVKTGDRCIRVSWICRKVRMLKSSKILETNILTERTIKIHPSSMSCSITPLFIGKSAPSFKQYSTHFSRLSFTYKKSPFLLKSSPIRCFKSTKH